MAVEKLMMQIGLIDQVSKPLGKMQRQFDSLAQQTKKSFTNIGIGAAGIFAGGAAIKSSLMPAIEMDRKMGELRSLDITGKSESAFKQLEKTARSFSVEYGKSAVDFVEASYKIQSSITGLKGEELANFTKATGVLAAATKADTMTMANYMGKMFGIFGKDAEKMGKSKWVDMVAGQTARAVQMFDTDGKKMADAFKGLGSSATAMNIPMSEQISTLGALSATMEGGEAATKYTAFLNGAIKAQEKLNVNFKDSRGNMLPMYKMLELVKGRIGHLGTVSQAAVLKDAFGSDEAVKAVQNLLGKTDELKANAKELSQIKGIGIAEKMAKTQTDQWQRLDEALNAVKIVLGGAILPALSKVAGAMANGSKELMKYMEQYPTLTKYAGFAITAILGIGIALGIATIAAGVFGGAMAILTSPITLVIAGIAALAAAVVIFWDDIKPILSGFYEGFVKAAGLDELFKPMKTIFYAIGDVIQWVMTKVADLFSETDKGQQSLSGLVQFGKMAGQALGGIFKLITTPIRFALKGVQWLIDKLNSLPGISIDVDKQLDAQIEKSLQQNAANNAVLKPQAGMPTFSTMYPPQSVMPAPVQQVEKTVTSNTNTTIEKMMPPMPLMPVEKMAHQVAANDGNITAPVSNIQNNQYLHPKVNTPVGGISKQLTNNNNAKTVYMGGVTVNNPPPSWDYITDAENQDLSHG